MAVREGKMAHELLYTFPLFLGNYTTLDIANACTGS